MILNVTCTDSGILAISKILKNIFYWLQILGPILAMIALAISILKIVTTNDESNIKKYRKNMLNSLFAMAMLFFLPYLMDITMGIIGEKTTFTSCWNSIDNVKLKFGSKYIKTKQEKEKEKKEPTKVYTDPKEYHGETTGELTLDKAGCLDHSYKGNGKVKSTFSSGTMKIVENHLNDFNYNNYSSVNIGNYAKELGGIFKVLYGQDIQVNSASGLQMVSEYVYGWMTIMGFDYWNGSKYCKWGGSCGSVNTKSQDAFYPSGTAYKGHGLSSPKKDFDKLLTNGNMTTNCNWTVDMVYYKAGLFGHKGQPIASSSFKSMGKKYQVITKMSDIQVGDIIHFFRNSIDRSNPNTWSNWYHVAFIGEVDKSKGVIVGYDGGSYFTNNRNYKWTAKINDKNPKVHGTSNFAVVRIANLKQDC